MRRDPDADFVEAMARGLDVILAFDATRPTMSLSEVATKANLPRPTARRMLLTLVSLGFARQTDEGFALTAQVLALGSAYIGSQRLWDVVRPHMVELVKSTHESCSIAQLDGSDIVYVARVAVPKLVTLSVTIGTRFPAFATSLGKVLLAALEPDELDSVLALPSRSDVVPSWRPSRDELAHELKQVSQRGWAITNQQLAHGITSIAAPLKTGDGETVAALNVNASSAETSSETLIEHYLPLLEATASAIGHDLTIIKSQPLLTLKP